MVKTGEKNRRAKRNRQKDKSKRTRQTDLSGRKKTDIWTVNKTKDR